MRDQKVTCAHFVPSMLRMFLRAKGLDELSLRLVFCSGEALRYDLRSDFLKRVKSELHNLYGPTEAAVDVSAWDCRDEAGDGIVPIGKPISNIQLFVLGEDMRPLPPGVTGELFIGGVGLARGYLNRPDLTAQSFIPNPVPGAAGDAPLPYRRSGAIPARREHRFPRPHRSPGEDQRPANRAGRDRSDVARARSRR